MKRLFSEIWLLICACVPGCGQMQQGYMKRGISQSVAFCVVLAAAIFLEMGVLACFLAPLWAYSFFDAYNLRRLVREGMPPEDCFLFGLSDMDSQRLEELMERRHGIVGWVLVGVGLLMLLQNVSRWVYELLSSLFGPDDIWWLYYGLLHVMPRLVVTLLIIALGIWFIRGPKKRHEDPGWDFTPAQDPQEPQEEPFTAKGPYSPEAQAHVPVELRLYPEGEDPDPAADPAAEPEESAEETEEVRHDGNG